MSTPVLTAVLTVSGTIVASIVAFLGVVWVSRRNAQAAEAKAEADERAAHGATQVEGRRADLAEYESLNRAMREEIDRIREDYDEDIRRLRVGFDEDRRRMHEEIEQLRAEVRWLRGDRADQIRRDRARTDWDQDMVRWVNAWLPKARALGLEIPDPPPAPVLPDLIDPDRLERRQ